MSVFSFLKISGGHGAPPMRPETAAHRRGRRQTSHQSQNIFIVFLCSDLLPASTDDKSYLCMSWLTKSVNIVGVPYRKLHLEGQNIKYNQWKFIMLWISDDEQSAVLFVLNGLQVGLAVVASGGEHQRDAIHRHTHPGQHWAKAVVQRYLYAYPHLRLMGTG